MINSRKSIILVLSCVFALVWQNQAFSMQYLSSALNKAKAYISNQWHGRTAEELQLIDSNIHPEILKQKKMQEILLFRHIKKELKRFKGSLKTKASINDEEANDENSDEISYQIDSETIWSSFFEYTLPNLNRLSKREKDTISNYFCSCKNEEEHQFCQKVKPDKNVRSLLELIDYLITTIKHQLTPDRRYTQKELDDCKDAQELVILITTKYPNASIKGKLKICIAMLSTFLTARAIISYKLYGLSLTMLKTTMMESLWCIPNLATGMYLPLLIPVMFTILKSL